MTAPQISTEYFDDTPTGDCVARTDGAFAAVFALERSMPAALRAFADEEALVLLTLDDTLTGVTVAALAAGKTGEVLRGFLPLRGRSFFSTVTILGGPGATAYERAIDQTLSASDSVCLLSRLPSEMSTAADTPDTADADLPSRWSALLQALGRRPAGRFAADPDACDNAWTSSTPARGMSGHYITEGRGAKAFGTLHADGFVVKAGSRSAPADPTPAFIAPLRNVVKQLAADGTLAKSDGVWCFTRDVCFPSAALAASVLMRTAAGTNAWIRTDDGSAD